MLIALFSVFFSLSSQASFKVHPVDDVCDVYRTMLHYTDNYCFTVKRPVTAENKATFTVRGLLVTKQNELDLVEKKQTIVLVPGGPGESAQMFRYALDRKDMILGMVGYLNVNVVLFDPRGTGASVLPKPATEYGGEALSSAMMVDDLAAVVKTVSAGGPVVLLAHSAGGSIAAQFAIKYPELVSKIVMVSTVVSPRQMAQVNLKQYALRDFTWETFMADPRHQALDLKSLDAKYRWIEDVVIQQTKAAILGQYFVDGFPAIAPLTLRDQVIVGSAQDGSGKVVEAAINDLYVKLQALNAKTPLAPEALRSLKISSENLPAFSDSEWIKAQIMCGEGMSPEELDTPVFLDGLTMARFCAGLHAKDAGSVVDVDLSKLTLPVLYFMGDRDTQIPAEMARPVISRIPGVQIIEEPAVGHLMFYEAPVVFYNGLEKFLLQ
jgi:pimeloyl-ACP methyl ester carboxylesterase